MTLPTGSSFSPQSPGYQEGRPQSKPVLNYSKVPHKKECTLCLLGCTRDVFLQAQRSTISRRRMAAWLTDYFGRPITSQQVANHGNHIHG